MSILKHRLACCLTIIQLGEWLFAVRDWVWYEMWLMIPTSAQEEGSGGFAPHKSRLWIIRSEDFLALIGLALLWLQVSLPLYSADCGLYALSLLRSFAVNVSEPNFRGPKNTLALSHVADLLELRALRNHCCKCPCSLEWSSENPLVEMFGVFLLRWEFSSIRIYSHRKNMVHPLSDLGFYVSTVKHGDGGVMIWVCCAATQPEHLVFEWIVSSSVY